MQWSDIDVKIELSSSDWKDTCADLLCNSLERSASSSNIVDKLNCPDGHMCICTCTRGCRELGSHVVPRDYCQSSFNGLG